MILEEAQQRISQSKTPKGVVVESADGKYFFLTDEDAKRTAISPGKLYAAYRHATRGSGRGTGEEKFVLHGCGAIKEWLDGSSPDSALWRQICLIYFDLCV
jgi:hypothetical protein